MLHKGFLHSDIGTAGVFCLLDPIEMAPFALGNFSQALGQPEAGKDDQMLQGQVERLREVIADLGITGSCRGVVQPSDMTVEMKDYYASGGEAHRPVPGLVVYRVGVAGCKKCSFFRTGANYDLSP